MGGNYEKLIVMWRDMIREMPDKYEKAKGLGLEVKDGKITVVYYGRSYILDLETGDIETPRGEKAPFGDAMFVYNLIWFSKHGPKASGEYVPFRDVKDAAVFDPAFKKYAKDVLADAFCGKLDLFCTACERLGGKKLPYGDAGYAIKAWEDIYMRVIFWDGDDEFPASCTLLFDRNITDFTHVESVVTIGGDCVEAIIKAANLDL